MTTATSSLSWVVDTNAHVDAWITSMNSLFTSAGLTQMTSGEVSGQLANTGYSAGAMGGNVVAGFQVFKFPDALQSTQPIIIRADFQCNSSGRPFVGLSVSGSVSGTGVLGTPNTGFSASAITVAYQTPLNSYACYTDGTFACVLGYGPNSDTTSNNNAASILVVDRARNSTGVAQGSGYLVEYAQAGSNSCFSRSMYGASSPALSSSFIPSMIPSAAAISTASGANVNVFRHYMMVPGVAPSLGCLTYFNSEFGALTPFSATVLGSTHTYLPVGRAMNLWSANASSITTISTNHCGAIRWE